MKNAFYWVATLALFGSFAMAAPTVSRTATLTCDFRPVASSPQGFDALGLLELKVDLDKRKVLATCKSTPCVFDGDQGKLRILSFLDGAPSRARFSFDGEDISTPRLILFGPNGDDSEVLVAIGNYGDATISLWVDGNLGPATAPVDCESTLK